MRFALWFLLGVIGAFLAFKKVKAPWWTLVGYYVCRVLLLVYMLVLTDGMMVDLSGWYEHAHRMTGGQFPGIDFLTPYGLIFNAILYVPVLVYDHPISIALAFLLFEVVGFLFFRKAVKIVAPDCVSPVSWLYMTSPLIVTYLGTWQQDEGVLLCFVSVLFYLLVSKRHWLIPIVAVFGCQFTKILAIIYFAPFFLVLSAKRAYAFVAMLALTGGALFACGVNPLCMRFERYSEAPDQIASMISKGYNVWSLFRNVFGFVPAVIPDAFYGVCLAAFLLFMFLRRREFGGGHVCVAVASAGVGLITLTFCKMQSGTYFTPMILPTSLAVVEFCRKRKRGGFACGCAFVAMQCCFNRGYFYRIFSEWLGFEFSFANNVHSVVDVSLTVTILSLIVRSLWKDGFRLESSIAGIRDFLLCRDEASLTALKQK